MFVVEEAVFEFGSHLKGIIGLDGGVSCTSYFYVDISGKFINLKIFFIHEYFFCVILPMRIYLKKILKHTSFVADLSLRLN